MVKEFEIFGAVLAVPGEPVLSDENESIAVPAVLKDTDNVAGFSFLPT